MTLDKLLDAERKQQTSEDVHSRHIIKRDALPEGFPTHKHDPAFWEALGRAVATFGFLEEMLCKAIFALTFTTNYEETTIEEAYKEWFPKLENALSDQLGGLIGVYGRAMRKNKGATAENLDELLEDLRNASRFRNAICHGSWGQPDTKGATVPFFINKQSEVFESPIDKAFLTQLQKNTNDLACTVIDSVTHMGWQFPGSIGPGEVIWRPVGPISAA